MLVVIADLTFEDRESIRLEGCTVRTLGPLVTPDEIVEAAAGADVLCIRDRFGKITREILERLPRLRCIVTRSVGFDHIDTGAASSRGVLVCNVPDYGANMIAELAFGLLLAVARKIVQADERYRCERRFRGDGLMGAELFGKTVGVIGTGRVGRCSIRIAHGFGMRVMAHDTVEDLEAARQMGFTYATLREVLAASDALTLHVPLLPSTHHLIDAGRLAEMKKGAYLVNTSRGAIVDTAALIDSLRRGHLGGAGLDVLEGEPDAYHDFAGLNVVVTPHIGWYTGEAAGRIMRSALETIAAFAEGRIVNRVPI